MPTPKPQPDDLHTQAAEPVPAGPAAKPRRLSSDELLQGAQELLIDHQGACYRLRLTAMGRLILTK